MGIKVDGSKVRLFATKRIATDAARAIGWPVKCVTPVQTRFCRSYALGMGADIDPVGGAFLSPQRFGELWDARNPGAIWSIEGHAGAANKGALGLIY